jgi:hypothetical protein
MTDIETATVVASAVVLVVGVPLAVFHRAIAKELRHLRAHIYSRHHRTTAGKAPRHKA